MKRGEIWTVAGGPAYVGKPRPAVILQNEFHPCIKSITICMLTTDTDEIPITRPPENPDRGNGIRSPSRLMADKITTLPEAKMGHKVENLSEEDMAELNRSVAVFLGLTDFLVCP